MDTAATANSPDAVLAVEHPETQRVPLVFASPHSGADYPAEFLAQSALDPQTLRRSEDTFVDQLFDCAPQFGAPLLRALFPRAYLDVNREPYELDPSMFDAPLPAFVNSTSPRVGAGLGTIARVVSTGAEIYRGKLDFTEAERRIASLYQPYHDRLRQLVEHTMQTFGRCILIDCHSMPSIGGPTEKDSGSSRVDVVLGDCYGSSCAARVIDTVEKSLRDMGYRVVRNSPYAGGFTTRHYGKPWNGRHALQIEVNRRLYMDERTHEKRPEFEKLQSHLGKVVEALAVMSVEDFRP